jgi:predicted dehydrogenase/nucleoside-diphosphate-sugar epimerase
VSAYHIRALQTLPHIRIVGIADTSFERARAVARRFAIPGVFTSLFAMRSAQPDVVHVLTPPASHVQLAIEALEMGCDVLVEKPMATSREECDEMIDAARRTGRTLSVNHSAKEDPIVVEALEQLRRGACGDVLAVDFYRTSEYPLYAGGVLPPAFRQGGYPFRDMGVHALSLMEAFLGSIQDLDVRYRSTGKDPNVFFDEWRGTVACARGRGGFYLSWSARPIRNELFVRGTAGDMHIDCFLQTCTVSRPLPGPKAITSAINALTRATHTVYDVPRNMVRFASGSLRLSPGIHAGVLKFHDALARRVIPPVTADQGRRLVAWSEPFARQADADRDRALRLTEPLPPRTVLVTGAAGLLGRALVERLRSEGASIRVMVRRPTIDFENMPHVQVVHGDLGDPEAVDRAIAGVQVVYHIGATMRGRGWAEFEAGTVRGTTNVVDSCVKHRVERLVHVSSLSVLDYCRLTARAVVDEAAALEPHPMKRGSYTRAKLLAERIVVDACDRKGLRAVVVRPGQIVGPGYESVPPYGAIAVGRRWVVIGSGRMKLPLVHVNDVVDGLLGATTRADVTGPVYHLVSTSRITQREYITRCQQETNRRLRVTYVPRIAVLAVSAGLDLVGTLLGRELPLTRYRIRSIKELTFDCAAARQELGWKPSLREVHLHNRVDDADGGELAGQRDRSEFV